MKKFYRKLSIPEFEIIKNELLSYIGDRHLKQSFTHSWIGDLVDIYKNCPTLRKFIVKHSKRPIKQIKFYCTPPESFLAPHVDGAKESKLPFGLNLPLIGTEKTYHYWYDCPPENTMLRPETDNTLYTKNYLSDVEVPKDPNIMPIIEKLELVEPCVTKTDIMHGVVNPGNNTRLIAVVRWDLVNLDYSEFEDVFDTNNLGIDPIV